MDYYGLMPGQSCCRTPGGTVLTRGAIYSPLSGTDESATGGEGCSCKSSAVTGPASGIESAIKSHPLLALVIAGCIGYALNTKGSRF